MCVDPDWVPFERINAQGQHEGIAADLVQLVAQRVGLELAQHELVVTLDADSYLYRDALKHLTARYLSDEHWLDIAIAPRASGTSDPEVA